MLRTVEMAIEDLRGTGLDVEVKAVDDLEDEAAAIHAARELVADPAVIAVVGHKNSGPSKSGAPVYAEAGMAQVTQCSTDNSLSRSGWRTFFRMCATNERQAEVAAAFANERRPGARVVAVHDGTAYGKPLVEAFAKRLESLSGSPVRVIAMRVGQEDFSEIVEEIKEAGAQIVDLGATEIESSKLMKAMRLAALRPLVISSEGGPDNPIVRLSGPAGEGSVHTYAGFDPLSTAESAKLVERCRAKFGETPSYVVECYDAVTVIGEALRAGAANRAEVRDAVASTDIEGFSGRIRFDANGDRLDAPVSLWTIARGRMVPLREAAVS